ncbi:MAG: hypothetical protein M3547_06345 [Acidobacteriota bacterium]|nr:hypothetical protein [Acidobacteriota bacterium]
MPKRKAAARKVPVSRRALVQRINRVLAKQKRRLLAGRTERVVRDLGRHYVVDAGGSRGCVRDHVDLEDFGRELGVIADYEALDEKEGGL